MKRISDEYSPVRKSQTVYGSISGNYSFRGEKTIWFESTLERDFLLKQEFNGNVVDVVGQPVSITYITELGNESTYTPDFLVQFYETKCHQPPLLIEVKPIQKLKKDWTILKPKLKAGLEYAHDQGWNFKIYDEKRIRDQ